MRNLNQNLGKKILLVGLAVMLAAGSGTALAQRPGGGPGCGTDKAFCGPGDRGPGSMMNLAMLTKKLDLTDEQSQAITAIREESRTKKMELRKELLRLKNARQGELLKDEPSSKEVLGLTEQMNEVQGQMRLDAMEARLAVREVLTPEQRDKMLAMRSDRPGRRGDHRPGHRGRGDGRFGNNKDCPLGNR